MRKSRKESRKTPFISIIIPVEDNTAYLVENLAKLAQQTYRHFEVLVSSTQSFSVKYDFVRVIADKKLRGNVSEKRNKIVEYGHGSLYVFHDDDVFTNPNYLENVVAIFSDPTVLAAGGPLLTPVTDSFLQQGSGLVLESYMGSMGAGTFRNRMAPSHVVYDFPAANLVMRDYVVKKLGGFESGLYPGENTKLCLKLLNEYKIGVEYSPKLAVFHHRKPLFVKHLAQIGRYGHQRGWFALSYPETSFKINYLLPSLFMIYCGICIVGSLILLLIGKHGNLFFLWFPFLSYGILVIGEALILTVRRNPFLALVVIPGIFLTHVYYGYRFLQSFFDKLASKIRLFISLTRKI